ncbi:MAG: ABC transporter permease, partial [Solirubrobacteraceae bacterium]
LGAPRQRLVQQLLLEHVWLGLAAGLFGLFLAWAAVSLIMARWGGQIPRADEVTLDAPIFVFALLVSLVSGAVAGTLPALRGTRAAPASLIASGGRTAARGGRNLAGASLVSLEIALALLLLTGAGLLIRSFRSVLGRDIGFETSVATVEATLTGARYDRDTVRRYVYWDALVDALRKVPGVDAVGLSQWIPLGMTGSGFIDVAGRDVPGAGAVYRVANQDFFRALRVPVLLGRIFGPEDGAGTPRVVVVNRAMAAKFWPGESVLGKQVRARSMEIRPNGDAADWLTVIGVVGDVRTFGLETDARPEMYVYFRQAPSWTTSMTALVHASTPAAALAGELRRAAHSVDPS